MIGSSPKHVRHIILHLAPRYQDTDSRWMVGQPASEYQHSGSIGMSLVLVPLAGMVASLVFSVVYAYATFHNPMAERPLATDELETDVEDEEGG